MPESLRTTLMRWGFNLFPAFWGTGARITYISDDYREVRVAVPLSWRTRNYVGTIFGGSMYGAIDGVHIVMLIKNLGPDYIVWDKAGSVRFRKPGRSTLYASVGLPPEEFDQIRAKLAPGEAIERVYRVDLADRAGTVHAEIEKTLHIRRREPPPAAPATH
jgi:Domain of unknown function (DUF4442)